jgi:signal transduction histidine kinase
LSFAVRVIHPIRMAADLQRDATTELSLDALAEVCRIANAAEHASGMLHDIGNALTSVNISSALALERMAGLKLSGLETLANLLLENEAHIGEFMTTDSRGQNLPSYLLAFARYLEEERLAVTDELTILRKGVEHVNAIIAEQQNQAKASGSSEIIAPAALAEQALALAENALIKNEALVVRDFAPAPDVNVPRQKVLQILGNLIRNALDAMASKDRLERVVSVRVGPLRPSTVAISVEDNGVGIAPGQMERMFKFGFTTKASGHGFGLFASANAARDLGGTLKVSSKGPGAGSVFTLELPVAEPPGGRNSA